MAEYVIKLADERGRIQEQVQVAGSAEELRSRFSQAGYYVYSVRPRGMRGVGGSRKRANLEAFIIFNQQFLTLVRAGSADSGLARHAGERAEKPDFSRAVGKCSRTGAHRRIAFGGI